VPDGVTRDQPSGNREQSGDQGWRAKWCSIVPERAAKGSRRTQQGCRGTSPVISGVQWEKPPVVAARPRERRGMPLRSTRLGRHRADRFGGWDDAGDVALARLHR